MENRPMMTEEIDSLIKDLLSSTEHCSARDVVAAGLITNLRENSIPIDRIPPMWRFVSCIQSAQPMSGGGPVEWWVQLERSIPWPSRTAGAWGPTLRAAVERAAFEATLYE